MFNGTAKSMTAPATRPPRMTRAQKVSRTRQSLLNAAMKIVGEFGHGEASIANITREANVALGTFYMHFESKQSLLDELLPWAGSNAHAFMDAAVDSAPTYLDFETRNFDALAEFMRRNPYYFRLISESEVATPDAYHAHIERSIARYTAALVAAHDRGELPHYRQNELEILATMLTSIKLLLFTRYTTSKGPQPNLRETYLNFVMRALKGEPSILLPNATMTKVSRKRRGSA
jgi:AcrR family transcriptional regulator